MTVRSFSFLSGLGLSAALIASILVTPATAKKHPPPPPPPPAPPPPASSTYVQRYAEVVDGVKCDVTPQAVQATADGGSIALATSSRPSAAASESCSGVSWIVKADASGRPQWQELLGCFNLPPGSYALAVSLRQTGDGGYVAAGGTNDGGTTGCGSLSGCPDQCGLVERLDATGKLLWSRVYSSGTGDHESTIVQIGQTSDGGFVAVGSFRDADSNLGAWILKLDGQGSVQWQRKLGPGGPSGVGRMHVYFNAVQPTADGGYVAAGEFYSYARRPEGDTGVLAVKLDANGNVTWQRGFNSFDGNGAPTASEHALSIIQTSEGGYLVGGNWNSTTGPGTCCRGALLLKLDANGNSEWQKAHSAGVYCFFNDYNTTCYALGADVYSVHQTADGGYLLAGSGDLKLQDSAPLVPWLAKADASGNLLWQHFYYETYSTGRPLSQYFASSDVASNGGQVALGFTTDPKDLSEALFAVKTDSAGLVGTCSQVHPATPLNARSIPGSQRSHPRSRCKRRAPRMATRRAQPAERRSRAEPDNVDRLGSAAENAADDHAVAQANREALNAGTKPRVAADEVPRARLVGRQRVLDGVGDVLGRGTCGAALDGEPAKCIDSRTVELGRLRRRVRTLARPDRRLDRARLDDRDVDPPRRELDAKRVGHRLERELRHRVRAQQRERVEPGDRAHVDDAAASRAQRGQAELRHPELPDDVHLELTAKFLRRQELERPGHRDAGVVHQPVQLTELERRRLLHVDEHLLRPFRSRAGATNAREHAPAAVAHPYGARRPDSGRRARDEDASQSSRCSAMRARCFAA